MKTKLNMYTLGLHVSPFLLRNGNRTFAVVQTLRTKCKGIWRWNHGRIFCLHNSGKGCEQWESVAPSPFIHSPFWRLDLLGRTLVQKTILVSSVRVYDTWPACCVVCPPPRVSSPSITIYLPRRHSSLLPHPLPSGNHHHGACVWDLFCSFCSSCLSICCFQFQNSTFELFYNIWVKSCGS